MSYLKGSHIVYGKAGVCCIDDICSMRFGTEKEERMYYILRPVGSPASTLYVPVDNEILTARMREVMTKQQIDSLLGSVRNRTLMWENDKKKRSEEFKRILRDKNQEEMLLMVGCIYLRKQELAEGGKKLNFTDEGFLQEAEKYIHEEFAYVLNIPVCEVSTYIQKKIGS